MVGGFLCLLDKRRYPLGSEVCFRLPVYLYVLSAPGWDMIEL